MSNGDHRPSVFLVMVNGQIDGAEFPTFDNVYCKSTFVYGPDWVLTSGLEEGMSQVGRASEETGRIAFNFPLDISFKSTNPSGWPQLVMACYGRDWAGHDVPRGYGAVHVPICPGNHRRRVALFRPESSSLLQQLSAWLTGRRPELIDPAIVASAEGRLVTRVSTVGFASVQFNVVLKDLHKLGYELPASAGGTAAPTPNLATLPSALPYSMPTGTKPKPARREQQQRERGETSGGTSGVLSPPPASSDSEVPGPSGRRGSGDSGSWAGRRGQLPSTTSETMLPIAEAEDSEHQEESQDDPDVVQAL